MCTNRARCVVVRRRGFGVRVRLGQSGGDVDWSNQAVRGGFGVRVRVVSPRLSCVSEVNADGLARPAWNATGSVDATDTQQAP